MRQHRLEGPHVAARGHAGNEELEKLVVEGASSEVIKKVAIEQGMLTLREDGMEKVRMGLTSIQEILRVVV